MSFLYHFRCVQIVDARVELRMWITSPDVLAWGARAVPKNTKSPLNTPHFAGILLREQCADGDALLIEHREQVRRSDRATQRAIDAGKGGQHGDPHSSIWLHMIALPKIASTRVERIVGFPAPKHAWSVGTTEKARASYADYWKAWHGWDGHSDPSGLAQFDLSITLVDSKWMPTAWPTGVKGTTAFARS